MVKVRRTRIEYVCSGFQTLRMKQLRRLNCRHFFNFRRKLSSSSSSSYKKAHSRSHFQSHPFFSQNLTLSSGDFSSEFLNIS